MLEVTRVQVLPKAPPSEESGTEHLTEKALTLEELVFADNVKKDVGFIIAKSTDWVIIPLPTSPSRRLSLSGFSGTVIFPEKRVFGRINSYLEKTLQTGPFRKFFSKVTPPRNGA